MSAERTVDSAGTSEDPPSTLGNTVAATGAPLFGELYGTDRETLARSVVVVPVGALEQHGPHLPIGFDYDVASLVAAEVAKRLPDTLVGPGLPWGYSQLHARSGITLCIESDLFVRVLTGLTSELIRNGCSKIVLVNGHNSNKPFLRIVVNDLAAKFQARVAALTYFDFAHRAFAEHRQGGPFSEGHAGELETSLALHLFPERVRHPLPEGRAVSRLTRYESEDVTQGALAQVGGDVAMAYPDGVMGLPRYASAELGRLCFDDAVGGICTFVQSYRTAVDNVAVDD